ncbi:recombinase family protein [Sphingobium sp. WCS2017Hpa-17]|uniref:recombinase family protein n=1 Tax=Sphingobium sp. WCS2017Hpa-17 TaxID=3073638 RepID=UPI00288C0E4B|nr:recombinase family protein [Sphingobium sp. WCS2017Hpa-17]
MVTEWIPSGASEVPSVAQKGRAAEYVRMAAVPQQFAINTQAEAIRRYADEHGYEIVRTYADHGIGGLSHRGRRGLQQLLDDVESDRANFSVLLIYDVSRWGRFQGLDEAIAYERRCARAAVAVHYCCEQFEGDGSIGSFTIKAIKRVLPACDAEPPWSR